MGSNFNFSLTDLASDDTSTDTKNNPYLREYLKGSPTNQALQTSSAYLKNQGQSYDTYASTSMLSISDIMMGGPLQNRASGVLNVQNVLTSSISQYGVAGGKIASANNMNIFKALTPTDISQEQQHTITTTPTGSTATVNSSNGAPTTNQPSGGLPSGSGPNGLPTGFVMYPNAGVPVLNFINLAMTKIGDKYVYGAAGPNTFDCSGLVMWCLQQLGPQFRSWPRVTGDQYKSTVAAKLNCPLEEAYNTAGALLFIAKGGDPAGEHVAISLGNNNAIIEAYATGYTVMKATLHGQYGGNWDVAGLIPGLDYSAVSYGNGISTVPSTPDPATRASSQ